MRLWVFKDLSVALRMSELVVSGISGCGQHCSIVSATVAIHLILVQVASRHCEVAEMFARYTVFAPTLGTITPVPVNQVHKEMLRETIKRTVNDLTALVFTHRFNVRFHGTRLRQHLSVQPMREQRHLSYRQVDAEGIQMPVQQRLLFRYIFIYWLF